MDREQFHFTAAPSPKFQMGRAIAVLIATSALVVLVAAIPARRLYMALLQGGAFWIHMPPWFQGAFAGCLMLVPFALIAQIVMLLPRSGIAGVPKWPMHKPIALTLIPMLAFAGYLGPARAGTAPNDKTKATVTPLEASYIQFQRAILSNPAGEALTRPQAAERLPYLLDTASSMEEELQKETFDPQAVVDSVGDDPASLYAWVRDKTFFVPYRGALRGPVGVLMDRLGNSLDRSLLLAELLTLAGYQVRFAHATLAQQQVSGLLAKIRAAAAPDNRPSRSAPSSGPSEVKFIEEYAGNFQISSAPLNKAVLQLRKELDKLAADASSQAGEQARELRTIIGDSAADKDDQRLSNAIADHWWVQMEQDGKWIDLDPTSSDAKLGQAVRAPQETFEVGTLPEEAYCTVDVHLVVERWAEDGLKEHEVMSHCLRPAELNEQEVVLSHVPFNWPAKLSLKRDEGIDRLKAAVLGVHEWLPILRVGADLLSHASFNENGEIDEQPAITGEAEAPSGDALALLGGTEKAPDKAEKRKRTPPRGSGVLTAEWVDYEIGVPGSRPRRIRRELFDLIGPAARASGKITAAPASEADRFARGLLLLGQTAVLVQKGQPSPEYLAHLTLRWLQTTRDELLSALEAEPPPAQEEGNRLLASMLPASDMLWSYALLRFTTSSVGPDIYIDTPNVVTVRTTPAVDSEGRLVRRDLFDIVANDVAVRAGVKEGPFAIRLGQGVADTNAERLVLAGSAVSANTLDLFSSAAAQGLKPILVSGSDESWGKTGWSPDAAARVKKDIADHFAVIVPPQPVAVGGLKRIGWWRVDRQTGTCVGVMDSGFHQAMAEKVSTDRVPTTMQYAEFCYRQMTPPGQAALAKVMVSYGSFGLADLAVAFIMGGLIFGLAGYALGVFDRPPPPNVRGVPG
jgi:hypothetical protein